jgi:hypothetical protein
VTGVARPRAGWAAKARSMHKRDDDIVLDEASATRFDESEWRWE